MPQPIIAVSSLTPVPRPDEWKPPADAKRRFEVKSARAAALMGLSKLACTLHEVAPGAAAYPFHSHRANEELFYVLSGSAELRYGSATYPAKAGDLIGCPTGGPDTAHQLVNTGAEPLRYLAVSTMIDPDVCEYPDSGKVGAYARDGEGEFAHLSMYASNVDYWQGE